VVVTVSGKESLRRCGRALSRPAKRLAVAGGLVLAGWALGAVLGTTASADELPAGFDGQGTVSAAATTSDNSVTSESDSVQPDAAQTSKPKSKTASVGAAGNGLLGGLIGGLVGTVGDTLATTVDTVHSTVETVKQTVGSVVDTVDQTVIGPITGGGSLTQVTSLPLLSNLVSSGGTVTSTVSTMSITVATPAVNSAPETPRPATPDATSYEPSATPTHPAGPRIAAQQQATVVEQPPTESGKRIGLPGNGGGSGGGGLPAAPSSPIAPASATAGHDGSGGARQNAILGSDVTTTQLRLMGASLDPEVDGAGRDAALPTTSPD